MLGLTATATMVTAASVSQHLGISDYKQATIRETPVPSNLLLSVSRDEDRDEVILSIILIYCRSFLYLTYKYEQILMYFFGRMACLNDKTSF